MDTKRKRVAADTDKTNEFIYLSIVFMPASCLCSPGRQSSPRICLWLTCAGALGALGALVAVEGKNLVIATLFALRLAQATSVSFISVSFEVAVRSEPSIMF